MGDFTPTWLKSDRDFTYTDRYGDKHQIKADDVVVFNDPDKPCAAFDGFDAAQQKGILAGNRDTQQAVAVAGQNCGEIVVIAPSEPPPLTDPSKTGSDTAPPGREESAQTLGAPNPNAFSTASYSLSPGVSDGRPLAQQFYDPKNRVPDYDIAFKLSSQGLDNNDLKLKLQSIFHNEPELGRAHPVFSTGDRNSKVTSNDPVIIATGQYALDITDVEIPSRGFPLRLRRIYRSGEVYFGPWGYNWDHNYNVYLRPLKDGKVAIWTGQMREDIFRPDPVTAFEPPVGIFCRLEQLVSSDGYQMTDPMGYKYLFAFPNDWPRADRLPLLQITDRIGNAQTLIYDIEGRLSRVTDTSGRFLAFTYGECNLIEELRDHSGRIWHYYHDTDIEHLIGVRCPQTSEYPEGLVECYEYDRDRSHPALRHNMTAKIDQLGRRVVENEYGDDPDSDDFARVIYQTYAGYEATFQATRLQYVPDDGKAVNIPALRVEVVDPGILYVYTFNYRGDLLDERFRLVLDGSNRLVARAWRYDAQANCIESRESNGLGKFEEFDFTNPDPLARGNLLSTRLIAPPSHPAAEREIGYYTYEPRYQQIKSFRDEAGRITSWVYDYEETAVNLGNVIRVEYPDVTLPDNTTQKAVERFTYDSTGLLSVRQTPEGYYHQYHYFSGGLSDSYLSQVTLDKAGANYTQSFNYDIWGNLTSFTDGLGNTWTYVYNEAGQLVRARLPAVNGSEDETRCYFSKLGHLRRIEVPRGAYEDGVIADPFLVHEFDYDLLGHLCESRYGVNTATMRRTTYRNDPQGRVLSSTDPMGVVTDNRYDERGLLLRTTGAVGTPEAASWVMRYDRNGNRVAIIDPIGLEHNSEYDSWDRLRLIRLPGNPQESRTEVHYHYGVRDELNQVETLGIPISNTTSASLGAVSYTYDERGRCYLRTVDGLSHVFWFDRDNNPIRTVDPRGNASVTAYDGVARASSTTDAAGNIIRWTYDLAGNVTTIEEVDIESLGSKSYQTIIQFDPRGRATSITDPLGNTTRTEYDARDFAVAVVSPLGIRTEARHDLDGNVVMRRVVGASQSVQHLFERDLLGRVTRYTDPLGAPTRFVYTAHGQMARMIFEDDTFHQVTYFPGSATIIDYETDTAGSMVKYMYGPTGAVSQLQFTPAPGVATIPDLFLEHDGMSRTVRLTQGGSTLQRAWDTAGRLLSDGFAGQSIQATYNDASGTVDHLYPDGRRQRTHLDTLGRIASITLEASGTGLIGPLAAGEELVRYRYSGRSRLASRMLHNGSKTLFDYDGSRRPSSVQHYDSADSLICGVSHVFDGAGRRRAKIALPAPATSALYKFDDFSRLIERAAGITAASPPDVTKQSDADAYLATLDAQSASLHEIFVINDAGDRLSREIQVLAQKNAESFSVNQRRQMTDITVSTGGPAQSIPILYGPDGNLQSDDRHLFVYDVLGRVVQIKNIQGKPLIDLKYDPLGRIGVRIVAGVETHLVYFAGLCFQESDNNGVARRQRLYGAAVDELLLDSSNTNIWCHQDTLSSLLAATDDSSAVLERYDYSAYGEPHIFAPDGIAPRAGSVIGLSAQFGGHHALPGLDLYAARARVYDPRTGRYLQRDPMGYQDGSCPYLYAAGDPVDLVDPSGKFIFVAMGLGALLGGVYGGFHAIGQNHHGWDIVKDIGIGVGVGALSGLTGGVMGEAFAGAYGAAAAGTSIMAGAVNTQTVAFIAGTTTTTTVVDMTLGQTIVATGGSALVEGLYTRQGLHAYYPEIAPQSTVTNQVEDFAFGAMMGVGIRGVNMYLRTREAGEIYTITENINEIKKGYVWGQTEGSVYGARSIENAKAAAATKKRDVGIIAFKGESAKLFQPHPIDGPFSAVKAMFRGEYRTAAGDIKIIEPSSYNTREKILTVTRAEMAPHSPNIPKQLGLYGEKTRRAGRLFFDQGLLGAGRGLMEIMIHPPK